MDKLLIINIISILQDVLLIIFHHRNQCNFRLRQKYQTPGNDFWP